MKELVQSAWFLLITGLASVVGLLLGVYALRRELQSHSLIRKSRWRIVVLVSCIILVAIGLKTYFSSNMPTAPTNDESNRNSNQSNRSSTKKARSTDDSIASVQCRNPPLSAMLNYWPVTYSSPAEYCHDYQAVDAGLVDGALSQDQEDWENGLTAHAGDAIYVGVWINNGAADNAEEINPRFGIARNVRLTTETETSPGTVHYVKVRFSGDNTNTVDSRFKILTNADERLEVVPLSGEIRNHRSNSILKQSFDVGNNTIPIGDMRPAWKDGRFIRFTIRVVH